MQPDIQSILNRLNELHPPFWKDFGFWIAVAVSGAGVYFSVRAFNEAKQAKQAATAAGKTVKLQTVTIELTEVAQKLDRVQPEIQFNEARDLLSEVSRRFRRATSPFASDAELSTAITAGRSALDAAHESLKSVRPNVGTKDEAAPPNTVYYAIEDSFASIANCVADLLGLCEKKTIDFGDDNGES
jgi:hypothetical protein